MILLHFRRGPGDTAGEKSHPESAKEAIHQSCGGARQVTPGSGGNLSLSLVSPSERKASALPTGFSRHQSTPVGALCWQICFSVVFAAIQ